MESFGRVANNSNRNLQNSIRGFDKEGLKPENRKIRTFPEVHPKEAAVYIQKVKKKARIVKTVNIIIALSILVFTLYMLWLFSKT